MKMNVGSAERINRVHERLGVGVLVKHVSLVELN